MMAKVPTIIPIPDDDEEEDEDQTQYTGTMYDISENAFNCLKGDWPKLNKDGSVKYCIDNVIAALRWLLEDRHIELKYDIWRKYNITKPSSIIYDDHAIDWLNDIGKEHKMFFSIAMFKDAMNRLARHNKFHSRIEYYVNLPKWDQIPRIETFVKDCLHLEGTKLEVKVIQMQLIASVRLVFIPGTMYDICPCLLSLARIYEIKDAGDALWAGQHSF